MGPSAPSTGNATIELARVTSVDLARRTVSVAGVYSHRAPIMVPLLTPYCHGEHGGGFDYMPEVGAYCYVVFPADDTAFILGYVINPSNAPSESASEDSAAALDVSGEREPLEPGDMRMATADGNQVVVRRGGLVQIGANGMCQRLYIPLENTVRDFFQRYQARSPLGAIDWGHPTIVYGSGTDNTQETPVLVRYSIKEVAQENVKTERHTIELCIGQLTEKNLDMEVDAEHVFAHKSVRTATWSQLPDGQNGVLSLCIYSHTQKKVTYAFQLNKDGHGFMRVCGNLLVECDQTVRVQANAVSVVCGDTTIDATTGAIKLASGEIDLAVHGGAALALHKTAAELSAAGAKLALTAAGPRLSGLNIFLGDNAADPVVTVKGLLAMCTAIQNAAAPLMANPLTAPVGAALAGVATAMAAAAPSAGSLTVKA